MQILTSHTPEDEITMESNSQAPDVTNVHKDAIERIDGLVSQTE